MKRRTSVEIMDLLWPLFAAMYFIILGLYKFFLSWWLSPLLQRRENQALWDDVQRNFYFLYTKGQPLKDRWPHPLPFDYASVYLIYENLRFCFTRGRGEMHVSLSPRDLPKESYKLEVVIAALDSKGIGEVPPPGNLAAAGDLLRARLDEINSAFSEGHYPEFKKELW
jgi:hypothetical protein